MPAPRRASRARARVSGLDPVHLRGAAEELVPLEPPPVPLRPLATRAGIGAGPTEQSPDGFGAAGPGPPLQASRSRRNARAGCRGQGPQREDGLERPLPRLDRAHPAVALSQELLAACRQLV